MTILGAVVRVRPEALEVIVPRMATLPGVDLALNPGDGRMVLVIEDARIGDATHSAPATLAAIANWPEVLSTSLAYEYSGPDAPAATGPEMTDYRAWRGSLTKAVDEGKPPPR